MKKQTSQKIILIGLRSDCVDYEKWPQLTPEKLKSAFADVIAELTAEGYDAIWCLTDQGAKAGEIELAKLMKSRGVMFGWIWLFIQVFFLENNSKSANF